MTATTAAKKKSKTGSSDDSSSTITTAVSDQDMIQGVIIHPLVLLSAADHYHRVARGTRKRVIGVLLGQILKGSVHATNSFAVPFEEDLKNPSIFYLDHNYLESMLLMFRKVNAKERVVGFYSSGPTIRSNDLRIHDIVQRFSFAGRPITFCIIDIRPDRPDLPVTSYKVVEEVLSTSASASATNKSQVRRTFTHVPVKMGALEAEEVGVEHLLRDINDPTVSTVASLIKSKLAGLATLTEKLVECKDYLEAVVAGRVLNPNTEILDNIQKIFNLLPNLNQQSLVRAMLIKTNDMMMAIYLASLIRSVIALHDLINNKIRYGQEMNAASEEAEAEEKKKKEKLAAKKKAAAAAAAADEEKKEDDDGDGDKKDKIGDAKKK